MHTRQSFALHRTPSDRAAPCRTLAAGGLSLPELLIALALLGLLSTQALPIWQGWSERQQVEATRDQLVMDLQSARVQALQRGQALRLQALSDCPWHSRSGSDWSCGWQLITRDDNGVLLDSHLSTALSVQYTKATPLEISARGEIGQVGERWTLQSRLWPAVAVQSVCLSSAGRVRWVASATCS